MLWLKRMRRAGITPNMFTYNILIDLYSKLGEAASAEQWLQMMVREGFHPDEITLVALRRVSNHRAVNLDSTESAIWAYGVIIFAYTSIGDRARAKEWHDQMA